jgi:hypothetical protein
MSFQFILGWLLIQFLNANPNQTIATQATISSAIVPAAPSDFLIISNDSGDTWTGMTKGLPEEIMAGAILATENTYFLGTSQGLFRGSAKLPVPGWHKEILQPSFVTGVFPGKQGPYAISSWNGIYRFQPSTGQWNQIDKGLKDKSSYAVLETKQGHIYTGSESGIYRSTDHGLTWQHLLDPGSIHSLAEINGTLFAVGSHRLWKSKDGAKWTRTLEPDLLPFSVNQANAGIVALVAGPEFAGYRSANEVMLSSDNGASWKPMFASLPKSLHTISDLKQIGNTLFACSNEGIFRSTDHGSTWEHIVALPEDNKGNFYKLYVNGQQLIAMRMTGC